MAGRMVKTAGLSNCTLSYGQAGQGYVLQTRARGIAHSWDVIATASHARRSQGFYPHQRSVGPFTLTLELMGYKELKLVMDWIRGYIDTSMSVNQNSITVSVPSYNFWRNGVPISGVLDNDHTGSNVFLPNVVFQSITDPLDPTTFTGMGNSVAQVDFGPTQLDDAAKFFYPSSIAVNDPNAKAESYYDNPALNSQVPPNLGPPTDFKPGSLTGRRGPF